MLLNLDKLSKARYFICLHYKSGVLQGRRYKKNKRSTEKSLEKKSEDLFQLYMYIMHIIIKKVLNTSIR